MKNILLVINPGKISTSAIYFGCHLAQLTQSRLTGIFVEQKIAAEISYFKDESGLSYGGAIAAPLNAVRLNAARLNAVRTQSIGKFKRICEEKGVRFNFQHDADYPLKELIAESRFADLLIVDKEISLEEEPGQIPSDFVKEILTRSECPVLVAPLHFDGVDEIVLAYEESSSSAFAIKQFSYLFPELEDLKITTFHVHKDAYEDEIQREKLSQWLSGHYSYPMFKIVTGVPETELLKYLGNKKRSIVVMGSYGRDAYSTIMLPSTADLLIEKLDLPFFFAHH